MFSLFNLLSKEEMRKMQLVKEVGESKDKLSLKQICTEGEPLALHTAQGYQENE